MATQSVVFEPFQKYGGSYTFEGWAESHPIPPPFLHGGKGSSFPGLVPPNVMVNSESMVGIKPGDSGVVIEYQVDEFTHTWFVDQFVACSHIYLGSWVRCHQLTIFHLNQGVRIIHF